MVRRVDGVDGVWGLVFRELGQSLCERTNVGVRALFVRPHRSQGTGLHRPVCSFARIAPRQAGGGERIYARPLAGGGDEEGSVGGPIETGRTGWRPQPAWRSLPLPGGSRVRKIGCRKFGAGSFVGSGKDLTRRKSFVYKSVLYDFPTM